MRVVSALILTAFLPLVRCQTSGLIYSRVLPVLTGGTTGSGIIDAIAVDAAGNTYLAGSTENPAFPITPGAPQSSFGGGTCTGSVFNPLLPPPTYPCDDAFVAELDPKGNILFATYLGGAGLDRATSMALDAAGNIYVVGTTTSIGLGAGHNFPTTPGGPFGDSTTGTVFLAKINPAAGLVYSYLIPGLEGRIVVAVDVQENVYFAATQNGFAPTPGALQGQGSIAVGKLNPAGTKLIYGAQFGGTNGTDSVAGIAVDSSGNAYLAGSTSASDFPVTAGAFQTTLTNPVEVAFVAKLNASGGALVYASYLGGSSLDLARQIRVDAEGDAYVLGATNSSDFPLTPNAYQLAGTNITSAGFLTEFRPDGSGLLFSTYVAGVFGLSASNSPMTNVNAFDLDTAGDTFLAGVASVGLPVTTGALQSCLGGAYSNMFAAALTPAGKLAAATYLGGSGVDQAQLIAVNPDGSVTLAGFTTSPDFPVTMGPEPFKIDYVVARLQISDPSRPNTPCMALVLENSASLLAGPIAPGELVTLRGAYFGPDTGQQGAVDSSGQLPTSLAGVRVLFDGIPAPLLYVQSQQINAQAPFELAGKQSTAVHVEYQGVASQTAQIQVRDAAADFFRVSPSPPNGSYPPPQGVIFNQDGTPNSPPNPAWVGSTVWILGTGGGVLTPPLSTGTLAPIAPLSFLPSPVTVIIDGGTPAQVTYAGSSPAASSGVFQINFVVPPVSSYLSVHYIDAIIAGSAIQEVSIAIQQ
jgi:uncharacterized protein (TIGR03437 family)